MFHNRSRYRKHIFVLGNLTKGYVKKYQIPPCDRSVSANRDLSANILHHFFPYINFCALTVSSSPRRPKPRGGDSCFLPDFPALSHRP